MYGKQIIIFLRLLQQLCEGKHFVCFVNISHVCTKAKCSPIEVVTIPEGK